MKIVLNGEAVDTAARTLAALLDEQGLTGKLATAVNEDFVPAALRAGHVLTEGDRVEVLSPMQGG